MRKLVEELFARYYKEVYLYLYSLSHDAALSEDLASDVFLEVVKSIATFRGESDIRTWLFSIARHKWFGYLRKQGRAEPEEELPAWLPVPGKTVEERCQQKELLRRVCQILEQEPERTRRIVWLRAEGYSFYEIGEQTGVSENSARVIEFRARAKLRRILKEEGFESV